MLNINQIKPQPGWALCRMILPSQETASGLVMGRDVEDGKTTEGVCKVLAVTPAVFDGGKKVMPGFRVGDRLLFREFLKNVNQVGELVGERSNRVFLLNTRDVLAVIDPGEGSLTLGHYGEYQL